ncbi:uncharacterized protein CXorf65-like [Liolophura sinensis]|uniref:uncharacterized protein CXorf65-like n=1 Tax=Liolophura sinensis TaxID=3198878 RepID=UPI003158759B
MFIVVKYGNNESLLCNPTCAVVNLLKSIKRRAGYANSNILLDLSDETGLVKELDTHKFDYATKHLVSHGTYILVMKEPVAVDSTDARAPSPPEQRFTYTPLLEKFAELFPQYTVHVQEVDKKKTRKSANKSPSPAGRMGLKSRKGVVKTSTTARRR